MKLLLRKNCGSHDGSTLLLSLVVISLLSFGIAGYFASIQQNHQLQFREAAWKAALPLAELGIEEAMAQILTRSDPSLNGWSFDAGAGFLLKSRELPEGKVFIGYTAQVPPTIFSTAVVQVAHLKRPVTRVVQVTTTNVPSSTSGGIVGRDYIYFNSTAGHVDSYNSSDPAGSTNGKYDPLKASDDALVATSGTGATNLFIGNRKVYGWSATPSGAPPVLGPNGSLGSTLWVNNPINAGKAQPDRVLKSFAGNYDPVAVPFNSGFPPASGTVGGTSYLYILDHGEYYLNSSLKLEGKAILVRGQATLVINGSLDVASSGYVQIEPTASLKVYVADKGYISITGQGFVNSSQIPSNLQILSNTSSFKMEGGSDFYGDIYVPNAVATLKGNSQFFGSVLGKGVVIEGNMIFHVDKAGRSNDLYRINYWAEL